MTKITQNDLRTPTAAHSRAKFLAEKAKALNDGTDRNISDLPVEAQATVLWRKAICDGFLEFEAGGRTDRSRQRSSTFTPRSPPRKRLA